MDLIWKRFDIVFVGVDTFLVVSLKKNEQISYSQNTMIENNDKYNKYFLKFSRPTVTAKINKISFNITGLVSLSEYMKSPLSQEQYFDIIKGIEKIVSFCKESSISAENLVCKPEYIYYDSKTKNVYMAYVPFQTPHSLCGSVAECLSKIHKKAKNVVVTDINYMKRYEELLENISSKKTGKAHKQQFFPEYLQHFFMENDMMAYAAEKENEKQQGKEKQQPYDTEYDIGAQIEFDEKELGRQNFSTNVTGNNNFDNQNDIGNSLNNGTSSPTFIPTNRDRTPPKNNVCEPCNVPPAYLEDKEFQKFYIDSDEFTIGREPPKSLCLYSRDTSRDHAVIRRKNDGYYITNHSTSGGTFLNEDFRNRITDDHKLNDGDRIYFYRTCFSFHYEPVSASSKTVINTNLVSSSTVIIDESAGNDRGGVPPVQENSRPLAYLIRCADGLRIKVTHYPFTSQYIPGVIFFRNDSKDRKDRVIILVHNIDCPSLNFENLRNIPVGGKEEIFSGCILSVNGEKYKFIAEN